MDNFNYDGLNLNFLWLKVKILGAFTKFMRLINKTIVYQSKTGIKEINPAFIKRSYDEIESVVISPKDLYLGIDFLKDEYSLMDVPIFNSPHYGLMKSLLDGGDGMDTEYVYRMLKGSLDERYEILAFYLDKTYFRNCFKKRMDEFKNGGAEHVVVYQFNNRYYIHDGKHRAALCCLLNQNVKCKVINFIDVCSEFNNKKIKKIMKFNEYQKHRYKFYFLKN